LVVFARPKDQESVKSTVEQLARPEPEETARRITVYTLESSGATSATGAITTLTAMFTDAKFSAGLEMGQIIAWARPVDHLQIAKAIEDMSKKDPPEKARRVVVYPFKATTLTAGTYILTMLRSLFPEAQFSLGSEPDKLVALARPKDHESIRTTVEQLAAPDPPEIARKIMVYTLEAAGPSSGALTTLGSMFPEAKFSAGTDPGQVIAWARPAEHAQIAKAVEEMSKREPPEKAARMASYTLEGSGAYGLTYALAVLRKAFPDAQFSVGSTPNQLFAWARPADQEAIKKSIDELSKGSKPTAQVYRFEWADPRAAYTALATLVPNAQIALDSASRSLVVSATPEDHAKIRATVDEMDRRDAKELPRLQVHHFKATDPANLLPVLQGLFKLHPQVQLALDERNGAIVAMATPAQQDTIRSLVEQVEKEAATDAAVRLEVYPLGEGDARAALQAVTALLEKQGARAELSIEPRSNSLVAIAHPEQHKAIQAALEQLKPEERTLEILQLDIVDPDTAELAIMRLFSGEGYANAPTLDSDVGSQQLFVRATKPQHEKIRELLVKLGETSLLQPDAAGPRLRVFPFEGDVEESVEEIRRVWSQLRRNPIEIVESLPEVIIRQRTAPDGEKPTGGSPPKPTQPPAGGEREPAATSGATTPAAKTVPQPAGVDAPPATPAAKTPATANDAAHKPVTIIPGDGSVTITSEDPAALRQFETLLRAMSRHRSVVGRNYAVFLLRNAKADEVAATLQQIFRTLPKTGADTDTRDTRSSRYGDSRRPRSSPVVIVPDERLNAIVAYASRTDRTTLESLVKVLDTSDLPESMVAQRLQIIPVENADAENVAENLRNLFKSQLDSLSVDEATNSLIALAPPPTMKEVKRVVAMLDEAAGGDSGRILELLPLQKTNATRMQDLLQPFLKPDKKPTASKRPSSAPLPKKVTTKATTAKTTPKPK
jgi:type II secretory pathway component GspD/PulD (secretin)